MYVQEKRPVKTLYIFLKIYRTILFFFVFRLFHFLFSGRQHLPPSYVCICMRSRYLRKRHTVCILYTAGKKIYFRIKWWNVCEEKLFLNVSFTTPPVALFFNITVSNVYTKVERNTVGTGYIVRIYVGVGTIGIQS